MKMFDDGGRAPKCAICHKVVYQYLLTDDDKIICIYCQGLME